MAQRLDYQHSTNGHSHHDQSITELIHQLAEEAGVLVRQEISLAKAEMTDKVQQSSLTAALLGVAALLALGAFATLSACFIVALAAAMPVWLAALIVTLVYLVGAGTAALMAKERIKNGPSLVPEQTIESIKEDVTWVKTHAQYGRK